MQAELFLASVIAVLCWGVYLNVYTRRELREVQEKYAALQYVMQLHGEQPKWHDFDDMSATCRSHVITLLSERDHPAQKLYIPGIQLHVPAEDEVSHDS